MSQIVRFTYCQWKVFRGRNRHLITRVSRNLTTKGIMRGRDRTCQSHVDQQYEEAVRALNGLQTNAAVLDRLREQTRIQEQRGLFVNNNIPVTERYLSRVGVSLDDLDKLSVIHIAGTKGKGSTCAFIESILREHGYRTGFYSSPHLVAVRERIRINGQPMQKECFNQHFWDVYNALSSSKESQGDMPAYFKFLTVMALKVFLREEVDVAVIEVGIGGEYDCTNVIRKPVVCGITTLDLDHTSVLGDTIESIAWHKSGIMKTSAPTFTVDQPQGSALSVLVERAKEKATKLFIVPPLESYGWGARPLQLGLAGSVQYSNASLALQLSQYWINIQNQGRIVAGIPSASSVNPSSRPATTTSFIVDSEDVYGQCVVGTPSASPVNANDRPTVATPFILDDEDVYGLRSAVWPGRSQVMSCGPLKFFIDGAHTVTSMKACIEWFTKSLQLSAPENKDIYRVLFFNTTGDRDPEILLQLLAECNFDLAVFTTNLTTMSMSASSDQTNFTISKDKMHLRCERQRISWIKLVRGLRKQTFNSKEESEFKGCTDEEQPFPSRLSAEQSENWDLSENLPASDVPSIIFPCINDALLWLSCGRCQSLQGDLVMPPAFPPPKQLQEASEVQILVTGSLHLVGGLLGVIDPGLSCARHMRTVQSKSTSLTDLVRSTCAESSPPGAP